MTTQDNSDGVVKPRLLLKDGRVVCIRKQRTDDKELFIGFFESMSERNRSFMRGFTFDRKQAEQISKQADSDDFYSLVVLPANSPIEKIIGYSWIVGLKTETIPMLGIGVVDEYQNANLGKILLRQVHKSVKELGVKKLVLGVFEDNLRAIHTYRSVGYKNYSDIPPKIFDGRKEIYMMVNTDGDGQ